MPEVHIVLEVICKVTRNGILGTFGHLVILVKGREGKLFEWFQVKLGGSQNNFNTPVGFTLTLDKIHGRRREFTVKLTSEVKLKRGQFSIIIEDSTLTGLIGTFKLRVPKLEY